MKERIKDILKEKGLTQKDLALKLNVKQETVSRQISGNPTLKTIREIANALDVDIKDLFYSTKDEEIIHLIIKNDLHTFDNVDELKEYVNGI